ncbi:MAG: energy-coupling factor transporter transmembrane component T family protein [Actinomycetota bacterium]
MGTSKISTDHPAYECEREVPAGPGALALVVWLISGLVIVLALDSPIAASVAIASAACVAALAADRRPFRLFLAVGLFAMVTRTVLFALSGHEGTHVLFRLPEASLPAPFGGAVFGGVVTREVLINGLSEGLRLAAILALFGAFASLANTVDLVQLVPNFLFDAGLVLAIGMTLTPQMVRSARDMREAQQMRGGNGGFFNLPRILVPLLAVAMERSIALAESMDSRGYATSTGHSQREGRWRAGTVVAALWTTAAACLWALGKGERIAAAAAVGGVAAIFVCVRSVSKMGQRTRYRFQRWETLDRLVAASSAVAALAAVAFGRGPGLGRTLPGAPAAPLLIAAAISLPAVIAGVARQGRESQISVGQSEIS